MPSTVGIVASGVEAGFSPLSLSPALWLDASDTSTITESGGSVSQWDDKSGNGYHVTQAVGASQPTTGTRTLNGLNVLDFVRGQFVDGGDILDLGSNPFSSFAVVKFDDTSGSSPFGKNIAGTTDGRYGLLRFVNQLNVIYDNDSTASGSVSVADTSTDARYISTILTRDGASSSHVLRRNGTPTTQTFTDVPTSWDTNAPWRVGRYGTSTLFSFDGFVAEIIVLLRTATASEISDTEAYLAAKWGL